MVNIVNCLLSNKLQRKLKGQSRMDNPEPLSTSDNTQTHMKLQSLQAFGKLKHNGKVTNTKHTSIAKDHRVHRKLY